MPDNKPVTFHPSGSAPGPFRSLAGAMARFTSMEELRALTPLPKDAQELIDTAVLSVQLDRLVIVRDLIEAGLVYNLPNWLSVPELYWEKESKTGHAQRTMVPRTREENQLADREGTRIPIYCTIDDFTIGIRELLASERAGAPLDTSHITQATRRVNEAIEDAMINGGPTVGGNSSPGLLNAPSVNTNAYVDNEAWDATGHTGNDILADVLAMADLLRADRFYGPYRLYVPVDYGNKLNENYTDGTTTQDYTILERLERLRFGGQNLIVREADLLPDDRTILMQMTDNVADVVMGQEPAPVSWEDGPGWNFYHAVLACVVPRVKDTYDNQSGICVGNTT